MDIIIVMAFVRDTSGPGLLRFAESIFKGNPGIDTVSFDFYGHLKTYKRENMIL